MRAAEHAPRGPFNLLERTHCLAEIVECGAGVPVERLVVMLASLVTVSQLTSNTSRRGVGQGGGAGGACCEDHGWSGRVACEFSRGVMKYFACF